MCTFFKFDIQSRLEVFKKYITTNHHIFCLFFDFFNEDLLLHLQVMFIEQM